jgi:hypothetical protein
MKNSNNPSVQPLVTEYANSFAYHTRKTSMDTKHARMCMCKKCKKLTKNFVFSYLRDLDHRNARPKHNFNIFVKGIYIFFVEVKNVYVFTSQSVLDILIQLDRHSYSFLKEFHLGVLSLAHCGEY